MNKGTLLSLLVLITQAVLLPGAYAHDWVRADLNTGAYSARVFVDIDSVSLRGDDAAHVMRIVRADDSYLEVLLTVRCGGKGTRIDEVREFNAGGKLIADYHGSQYRLEIDEDAVFEILRLASCDGDTVNPLEKIKRLNGVREYVLSKGKKKK